MNDNKTLDSKIKKESYTIRTLHTDVINVFIVLLSKEGGERLQ